MERLTKRIGNYTYYTKGTYPETVPAECNAGDVRNILTRLAAYEDTGLEPNEIPTGLELANVFCAMQKLKRYEAAEKDGRMFPWVCIGQMDKNGVPIREGDTLIGKDKHRFTVRYNPDIASFVAIPEDNDESSRPCLNYGTTKHLEVV